MRSFLASICKPFFLFRIALVAALTLLLSGWTCSAMFLSCHGLEPLQVTALSPDAISSSAESVRLTAEGSGFTPQSQIMWNGNALTTTFMDSRHIQTTITRQTLDSFGGSVDSTVKISVKSQASFDDMGCPIGGNSATLILVIN